MDIHQPHPRKPLAAEIPRSEGDDAATVDVL
jgi:hypothetical protein